MSYERRSGLVDEFDEHRGLGAVTTSDGRRFEFHATQIVGGQRRVDLGAEVTFVLRPGPAGRLEAFALEPVSG